MNINQALQKAHTKVDNLDCIGVLDMGEMWAFAFGKKGEMCGGAYITVDKSNGELGTFNPIQNFELFRKSKRVAI